MSINAALPKHFWPILAVSTFNRKDAASFIQFCVERRRVRVKKKKQKKTETTKLWFGDIQMYLVDWCFVIIFFRGKHKHTGAYWLR